MRQMILCLYLIQADVRHSATMQELLEVSFVGKRVNEQRRLIVGVEAAGAQAVDVRMS